MNFSRFVPIAIIGISLFLAPAALALDSEAARIDFPLPGSTVSGRVDVRGSAGGSPQFRSFRLEVGPGRSPARWQVIGPERDRSVQNGVLGLWETAGLAPGTYTLRLLVFDESGHEQEARVEVTVAAPTVAEPVATPTPPEPAPSPEPVPEPGSASRPADAGTDSRAGCGRAEAPAPEPAALNPQAVRCPMLYYHEVPGQAGLAAQVGAFLAAGYRPVTMGRLVEAIEGRAEAPRNCLVLTFDDALASQMTGALPVLLRFQVPATFFVMPYFRDGVHRYMTPDDFRTLRDSGLEIGSHTLNHASLPALLRSNYGAFQSELVNSKRYLEAELGQPVELLAYPNGSWDYATAAQVRALGYRAAATTMPGSLQRPDDLFWLRRLRADPWEAPATVLGRLRG